MDSDSVWVGLDVGADTTRVCVIGSNGSVRHESTVATEARTVSEALSEFPPESIKMIALEAGGFGTHLVRKLRTLGRQVTVYETRQVAKFLRIRRNKTDANDARGLAEIALYGAQSVSVVHLKSLECQQIRTKLALRHRLIAHRLSGEGFIRSLLRLHGGRLRQVRSAKCLRPAVDAAISEIKSAESVDLKPEIGPLLDLCESIRVYLEKLDRSLLQLAKSHPVCSRFLEISGVGPICSLSFYSAIENPQRFRRSANVAAYLGLVPLVRQSGSQTIRRRISKMGSKLTRTHLVTAASVHLGASKQKSALRDWGEYLTARIGRPKAKVAVARKLAVVMLSMWKNDDKFRPFATASG